MRIIFTVFSLMTLVGHSFGQTIYTSDTSMVSFFSATPIEDIEAFNSASTSLLNVAKSEIVFRVPISGFQFEKPLMQEHFNENYMDSYQYPKATFKGNLDDFSMANLNTNNTFDLKGVLAIKGLEKNIQTSVTVKQKDNRMFVSGVFFVSPEDFDISIPSIVRDKIAKQIQIKIDYELIEKK